MSFEKDMLKLIAERNIKLEDAGIRPAPSSQFVTALMANLEIDLPLRIETADAANEFLYSYHTGDSETLQQVRAEDLLSAIFHDLHSAKLGMIPHYQQELEWQRQGELDEEDIAMTETLGRRISGLSDSILKIAEMRQNAGHSFEVIKAVAAQVRDMEKQTLPLFSESLGREP